MMKLRAQAAEKASKMKLPQPVGSRPEPEYLKPAFLAQPPPSLAMQQKAPTLAMQKAMEGGRVMELKSLFISSLCP